MPEETQHKEIQGLQRLSQMFEAGAFTKQEGQDFLKKLADLVLKIDQKQNQEIETLRQAVQQLMAKVEGKFDIKLTELRKQTDSLFVGSRISKMESDHSNRMKGVDERMARVRDGRDGLPGLRGLQGLQGSPDTPNQVVQKINSAGDSIDLEKIKGLKELVKQYHKEIMGTVRLGGGSGNYGRIAGRHIQETPTGSVNSSNRVFYLSAIPIPGSLLLTKNGQMQRVGSSNEFTQVDRTITFNGDANKPETGDLLWAKYEKF